MSLRHIQALLGHTSPATTARYTHLSQITERDAAATINDLIDRLRADLQKV